MRPQNPTRRLSCLFVVAALVTAIGVTAAVLRRCARPGAARWPKATTAPWPPDRGAPPSKAKRATPPRDGGARSSAAKKATPRSARNGNVVTGEEVDVDGVAVGRRGAVVVGEEGAAAVGRYGGVVVADRYESYDAWKAVAAVGAGIAIGTMLAKPPAAATPVVVADRPTTITTTCSTRA